MSPQSLLYKVWRPDTAPTTADPLLTLHSEEAVRFFVRTVVSDHCLFTYKPFTMAAYHVRNQLIESQVAEATYRLGRWVDMDNEPPLHIAAESSMPTRSGGLNIITASILDALVAIKKQEQVL